MYELKIQLQTGDLDRIRALPEAARQGIGDGLEAFAVDVEGRARANAMDQLNRNPTGTLANSITHYVDREALTAEVGVPSSVPYGRIHEFGGTIQPVNAKVLRFVVDGRVVFTKAVVIPARPYLGPALDAASPLVGDLVEKPIKDVLGR